MKNLDLLPLEEKEMFELAMRLVEIAHKYNLTVESCAERINLDQFGIAHGHCIDCNLFERLLGQKLDLGKDKNQREECGCMASIDIGMYNTCKNGCISTAHKIPLLYLFFFFFLSFSLRKLPETP